MRIHLKWFKIYGLPFGSKCNTMVFAQYVRLFLGLLQFTSCRVSLHVQLLWSDFCFFTLNRRQSKIITAGFCGFMFKSAARVKQNRARTASSRTAVSGPPGRAVWLYYIPCVTYVLKQSRACVNEPQDLQLERMQRAISLYGECVVHIWTEPCCSITGIGIPPSCRSCGSLTQALDSFKTHVAQDT